MPTFWVGTMLVIVLSIFFDWIPPLIYKNFWEDFKTNFTQLVFPALVLGFFANAVTARMTRAQMLEIMRFDYIRTARAKGLHERLIIMRHALRNALLPVATVAGLQFGALLGGTVITETIFGLPGLGRLFVSSVFERDYPVLQTITLLFAGIFLVLNLMVDCCTDGWTPGFVTNNRGALCFPKNVPISLKRRFPAPPDGGRLSFASCEPSPWGDWDWPCCSSSLWPPYSLPSWRPSTLPAPSLVRVRLAPSNTLSGWERTGWGVISSAASSSGARLSLIVGLSTVILGTAAGTCIGILSAYAGGIFDLLVQRFIDSISAFPHLILAMVLVSIMSRGPMAVILALAIVNVPLTARTVRSTALLSRRTTTPLPPGPSAPAASASFLCTSFPTA